jgi:hypothetical protein
MGGSLYDDDDDAKKHPSFGRLLVRGPPRTLFQNLACFSLEKSKLGTPREYKKRTFIQGAPPTKSSSSLPSTRGVTPTYPRVRAGVVRCDAFPSPPALALPDYHWLCLGWGCLYKLNPVDPYGLKAPPGFNPRA